MTYEPCCGLDRTPSNSCRPNFAMAGRYYLSPVAVHPQKKPGLENAGRAFWWATTAAGGLHHAPTINRQFHAIQEGSIVGGQEHRHGSDIRRLGHAAQRNGGNKLG